jgi:hypothetical protein
LGGLPSAYTTIHDCIQNVLDIGSLEEKKVLTSWVAEEFYASLIYMLGVDYPDYTFPRSFLLLPEPLQIRSIDLRLPSLSDTSLERLRPTAVVQKTKLGSPAITQAAPPPARSAIKLENDQMREEVARLENLKLRERLKVLRGGEAPLRSPEEDAPEEKKKKQRTATPQQKEKK